MFIGHYAIALAAKRIAPNTSLGTMFLSVQLLDLLWPIFLLLGIEHVKIDPGNTVVAPFDFYDYPISHSLLGVVLWSLAFGGIYMIVRKYRRGALIVAAGVLSHWFLDAVVHRPDLPIIPGSNTYIGLGLWNSFIWTVLIELGIFLVCLVLYLRKTRASTGIGKYGFWTLMTVLLSIWLGSLFGPLPPSEFAVALAGLTLWLLVPFAYWVDRNRKVRESVE